MYYQFGRAPVSPEIVSQQEKVTEVEVEAFNDSINRLFSKLVFSLNFVQLYRVCGLYPMVLVSTVLKC
jgi:hypothetical protein